MSLDIISKGSLNKMSEKKKKSIFSIFDEISSNFESGIREGLENLNHLISNVVEFMELAGNVETINSMKRVDIDEDSDEKEEDIII